MGIVAILSMNTTAVTVSSLIRAKAFYSHLFQQMPEIADHDTGNIIFNLGSKTLVLCHQATPPLAYPRDIDICLYVDDLQYEYQRIQMIPQASFLTARDDEDGSMELIVGDPDGNRLTIRSMSLTDTAEPQPT